MITREYLHSILNKIKESHVLTSKELADVNQIFDSLSLATDIYVCDKCLNPNKEDCKSCNRNYMFYNNNTCNKFMEYLPVCPYGYTDCIYDLAYIQYKYPDEYLSQFGDMPPEDAIKIQCKREIAHVNEFDDCDMFDDENK